MKKIGMSLTLLIASAAAAPAMASSCAITIEGNDQMQFNIKKVEVPKTCTDFTMTLKHTGKMSLASMGHNIVLTSTADANAAAADGLRAGLSGDYVKPGDPRVLGFSQMVGGGATTTMRFAVSQLQPGTEYTYFCSFPGHSFIMRGTLRLGS